MANHADVVILGGGVIGLTTAYFLGREGVRVAVLDKGGFGQESSWAGAGILSPADPLPAQTPYQRLRALSANMFRSLSEELRELTGIDNGYLRSGGLEFLRTSSAPREEWHAAEAGVQVLDEPDLQSLEPNLGRGLGKAHFLGDMAQLRNPRHMKALQAACASCGVSLHPGSLGHGLVREGRRIKAVQTSTSIFTGNRFLLATGAWTDPLLEPLACRPGIHPVRGQIALLSTGSAVFRRILLWGDQYLVPRPDGRVLVGSTQEKVGFDKRTTAEAIRDLLELAEKLVPVLAKAHLERCWAGLRPGSPDGLPFLGAVPGFDNLFVAAGHFRSGIQLSPGTAVVMKEALMAQPLSVPLEAFRLDR